jgi:hypothetical protein
LLFPKVCRPPGGHLPHFQTDGASVAVLGLLDQENHEKRDNRRSRIDGELPRVGITANGPQDQPDHDGPEGDLECLRTASPVGNRLGGQEKNGWFAARASRSKVDAFRCSQTLHENEDVVSSLQ